VGVLPGVGSFYDPPFRRPEGVGGAFLGDLALQPAFLQESLRGRRSNRRLGRGGRSPALGQPSQGLQEYRGWGPTAASRGGWPGPPKRPEGDALGVNHRRALEALLAAIHRAFARLLPSARGFRDAALDGHLGEFETDGPLVGFARRLLQRSSITPASIHSWRLRLRVVAEHDPSAIRQ